MSTAIARNFQIGIDPTPTNNFTLYQPASPDGTLRLGNGNTGITSSLLTLTSAGNLGVGTSSPTSISGYRTLSLNGSTSGLLDVQCNGVTNGYIYASGSGLILDGKGATSDLIFSTNGAERMRVQNSSGNVGIGTSSPATRLHAQTTGADIEVRATAISSGNVRFGFDASGAFYNWIQTDRASGALQFAQGNTIRASIDTGGNFQFNSGYGSVATAYGCRAWVNFNGTGTVAIRASGNVSSITDNGVGDYTVNFTTAMPDASYCVAGVAAASTTKADLCGFASATPYTTTTARILTSAGGGPTAQVDPENVSIAIFR